MNIFENLDFSTIPEALHGLLRRQLEQMVERHPDIQWPESPHWQELARVWACSEFVSGVCIARPEVLLDLFESGDLGVDYGKTTLIEHLNALTSDVEDEANFARILREFRRREMVRIAWRDFAKTASLSTSMMDLSLLAEACVQVASRFVQSDMERLHGQPRSKDGEALDLIVLGMGKLGAYELNYSSDIDLIFAFVEEGETEGGERKPLYHSEFFTRVGRRLTNLLDEKTVDGFVFRVDTRLRPFGQSGQLALSFDAMESYYEQHGREWERYAMVKARVIAGNSKHGEALMKSLKPFVYRRYIDFSAFESLREMKQLIAAEVKRKDMQDNIKLGSGGIREIEFIGQAFQLIRGGQESRLQDRRIQHILDFLGQSGMVPPYVVERLIGAYRFLRLSENRIQAFADKQTHMLPADELERLRLAYAMGFDSWQQYLEVLNEHREVVAEHFSQIFSAPQVDQSEEEYDEDFAAYATVWHQSITRDSALEVLSRHGYSDAETALTQIYALHDSRQVQALSPRARNRLDRLMPMLMGAVSAHENTNDCLILILNLIEKIVKRSVYIAMLIEHPVGLSQLVRLFAASPWIAQQITRSPVLLDELLDPRKLYEPMNKEDLSEELKIRMAGLEQDDLEAQMEILRQFRHANVLRVAASQLTNAMPLAKVSDHLTFIAEVVLQKVLELAMAQLERRHGVPCYELDGVEHQAGFAVIAYGKMGGWEMGFGSDMDLVFLHDSQGQKQMTNGERVVDNATFFARLGQRIIHILTAQTANGVLYEVDTRLRPSGQSGLLVSNLVSFREYQWNQAWTWEHQALIRARWVAGSQTIKQEFEQIRYEVLTRQRDAKVLADEVRNMRQRMRENLGSKTAGVFDLKQDAGGITDIEFMIQFLILRWAHEYPELIEYSDNLRLIEGLARVGKLSEDEAGFLANAYLNYRHSVHELTLGQAAKATADEQAFQESREGVTRIWEKVLEFGH